MSCQASGRRRGWLAPAARRSCGEQPAESQAPGGRVASATGNLTQPVQTLPTSTLRAFSDRTAHSTSPRMPGPRAHAVLSSSHRDHWISGSPGTEELVWVLRKFRQHNSGGKCGPRPKGFPAPPSRLRHLGLQSVSALRGAPCCHLGLAPCLLHCLLGVCGSQGTLVNRAFPLPSA